MLRQTSTQVSLRGVLFGGGGRGSRGLDQLGQAQVELRPLGLRQSYQVN
jgi:hypothetical protein